MHSPAVLQTALAHTAHPLTHPVASPISADTLLGHGALAVLCLIIFAECGLLIGFFLPGDTLLFSAGISIATGSISTHLGWFLLLVPIAAIAGNVLGYWIGYAAGPKVFDKPDSRLFRPEYVQRSQAFFDRFGWATIVVARFVPLVRTFVTVMAGASKMRFSTYLLSSIVGGIIWTDGILLLGHQLGKIGWVREHKGWVDYAVLAVVVLALVPTLVHVLRGRRPDQPTGRHTRQPEGVDS